MSWGRHSGPASPYRARHCVVDGGHDGQVTAVQSPVFTGSVPSKSHDQRWAVAPRRTWTHSSTPPLPATWGQGLEGDGGPHAYIKTARGGRGAGEQGARERPEKGPAPVRKCLSALARLRGYDHHAAGYPVDAPLDGTLFPPNFSELSCGNALGLTAGTARGTLSEYAL